MDMDSRTHVGMDDDGVGEFPFFARSGKPVLVTILASFFVVVPLLVVLGSTVSPIFFPFIAPTAVTAFVMLFGFLVNQPNEATVVLLCGNYLGTIRQTGWFHVNPFCSKNKVSLRMRSLETGSQLVGGGIVKEGDRTVRLQRTRTAGKPIKVNDARGSPVDISAVIVWKVHDTARAFFAVDDYEDFVGLQCEAALRNMAATYPYDSHGDRGYLSLRGNTADICLVLQRDVQERLRQAGLEVMEARLNHLAYAPEVANSMLQRQQAQAVIDARSQIVDGSISIVEKTMARLETSGMRIDDNAKMRLASNLLVVLSGQHSPQPIISVNGNNL